MNLKPENIFKAWDTVHKSLKKDNSISNVEKVTLLAIDALLRAFFTFSWDSRDQQVSHNLDLEWQQYLKRTDNV